MRFAVFNVKIFFGYADHVIGATGIAQTIVVNMVIRNGGGLPEENMSPHPKGAQTIETGSVNIENAKPTKPIAIQA